MNKLNNAIKDLANFDLSNREKYQKLHTSFSLFDGVLWIMPILVAVSMLLYNGWFFLKRLLVENIDGLQLKSALNANPKTNNVMIVLIAAGLAFAVIEKFLIGKRVLNNRADKKRIDKERMELIAACDSAAKESGREIYPFWNSFNALSYQDKHSVKESMLILPRNPIEKDGQGEYIAEFSDSIPVVSGSQVLSEMGRLSEPHELFSEEIDLSKKYRVGYLFLASVRSAEYTYEVEDEDSRNRKIDEYSRKLDDRERAYNLYTSGNYKTDEDMYFTGKSSASTFVFDTFIRDEKMKRFQNSVSGDFVTRTKNEGLWHFYLERVGYIVTDIDCKTVIGVVFEGAAKCYYWDLLTTDSKPGKQCRVEKSKLDIRSAARAKEVLRLLPNYILSPIDFSVAKPENVTDEEWGLWIYAHYTDCELFAKNAQ